jgi:uncharacterized small protein (DUF1192 family)
MARDDEDVFGARPATHVVGQMLDDLSVEELGLRIEALRAEIERLERAREAKEATRAGASAFFKPVP